jgi:hypothetical protein
MGYSSNTIATITAITASSSITASTTVIGIATMLIN